MPTPDFSYFCLFKKEQYHEITNKSINEILNMLILPNAHILQINLIPISSTLKPETFMR